AVARVPGQFLGHFAGRGRCPAEGFPRAGSREPREVGGMMAGLLQPSDEAIDARLFQRLTAGVAFTKVLLDRRRLVLRQPSLAECPQLVRAGMNRHFHEHEGLSFWYSCPRAPGLRGEESNGAPKGNDTGCSTFSEDAEDPRVRSRFPTAVGNARRGVPSGLRNATAGVPYSA